MPLRFHQHRPARPPRSALAGAGTRLASLVLGLGLVALLMHSVQAPATREKLALLFGDSPPVVNPPPADPQAAGDGYLPGLDRSQLEAIEDNTHFRNQESDAWFHLLALARQASDQQLAKLSVGEVVFAQYLGQPEVYRGRVVTVEGNARRIETVDPATNDLGFDRLYRIIVQPDRDVRRPFTLYCLELPAGWSPDGEIVGDGRLRCHAMFFKNWVYNHARGVDLSPVFIARSFTPLVTAPPQPYGDRTPTLWQTVLLAATVAVALVCWIALGSREPSRPTLGPDAEQLRAELAALGEQQEEAV